MKQSGVAALGVGLSGCLTHNGSHGGQATRSLRIRNEASNNPLARRTVRILKDRIEHRSSLRVDEVPGEADLILSLDPKVEPEAFAIQQEGRAVRIRGGGGSGLLYGVGRFLRTSRYGSVFQPSEWRGSSAPRGTIRGVYFASHFHNWYVQATEEEITRYLEDLALWGVNAVKVIFPMINLQGWDDPEAGPGLAMMKKYGRAARLLGIQFATGINNTMFIGAPAEIRAKRLPDPTGRRGNSGHPICPSNPAGRAYLLENAEQFFTRLSDVGLDILVHWPYDEGGCACERCQPWGSNGYLKLSREFTELGRKHFPGLKSVLSTWMFDTPPENEWQGLSEALNRGEPWLDYILADSHEDFPRYPLEKGVPGNRPLLSFPEISMWGNWPWGGFGANPLPSRFQRLWDQVKRAVQGGFPYSEGIYEDLNKAVVAQFYWDSNRTARSTLEEYISYEFGPGVTSEVLEMVELLESTASASYRKQQVVREEVVRANQIAEGVHQRLPKWAQDSWRWELLLIRTRLDRERFGGGGLQSAAAEAALMRLFEIYHCQMETSDPYHHRVRPPLKRAVDRAGRK